MSDRTQPQLPLWNRIGGALFITVALLTILQQLDGHWQKLTDRHLYENLMWLGSSMYYWVQRPEGLIALTLLTLVATTQWILTGSHPRIKHIVDTMQHLATVMVMRCRGKSLKQPRLH